MRLVVKQNGVVLNEFQFTQGPIHIGRHTDSQIFLSDRLVSRHHAVIFSTQDGKWMLEDLDSVNKTYLNDKAINKAQLKTGDSIRISNFTLEVSLENQADTKGQIHLEDTLTKTAYNLGDTFSPSALEPQIIVRWPQAKHAPDMRLPAKRAKDFLEATEKVCRTNGIEEVVTALLQIAANQFNAYHAWCALRNQPEGAMICNAGRKRNTEAVALEEIKLRDKIDVAVEKHQFLLFPRIPPKDGEKEKIHSAMIAPILGVPGCFGVLYMDNSMSHEHYSISDLDYLILIAIHTAAILENF